MKKQFLFFVLVLLSCSTVLFSCKKDDEEAKKDLITARWEAETLTTTGTVNGIALPVDVQDLTGSFVEFKADGTYTSDDNGVFDGSGTWKFSNGEKDIIIDAGTDDEIMFTITAISSNDLKLSFSEKDTEDGITFQVTGVMDFKK